MPTHLLHADHSFTTAGLKPRDQFEYWRELVCDEFVQLDCERADRGAFSGEIRSDKLDRIQLSEVSSDPQHVVRSNRQISRSSEREFLLSLQISSTGVVRQGGREAVLQPGDFAIYDSARPYTLDFHQPFQQLVLQIPHEVLSNYLKSAEDCTAIAISGQSGAGSLVSQFLSSVAGRTRELDQVRPQIEDNIFSLLCMSLGSAKELQAVDSRSSVMVAQLEKIKVFIENNLHDERLSPQFVADAFNISKRYLHKLFELEEMPVARFILQRRLEQCRQHLLDPRFAGQRIEQIAFRWGFNSSPHFSKVFKQFTGLSPRAYRNRHFGKATH
ncbi:helix-turn-helix domain-containing protein [Pseudomaricurvus alkylphenolicus]|jgi:AraC-like DNA-binding protein|uniref:AraC-like ligand-binding domain-containing protein n=1 Tax=Pseudomaricurvus alkylphenolicus TaxID=1306991 RepID=UPI001422695D|nr:helix-turn-helix domain-containing protein [Pseudomaricurvus alkylphenolicus]NIB42824.1 helix-turn-helix domain-containing protein [Pseudomaricurvus alkylphenolicus]